MWRNVLFTRVVCVAVVKLSYAEGVDEETILCELRIKGDQKRGLNTRNELK